MSMCTESSKMLIMNKVVIMDTEVDTSILFLENFMPGGPFFEQISVINLNLQTLTIIIIMFSTWY